MPGEVGTGTGVAARFAPALVALLGDPVPVRVRFWDNSAIGPEDTSDCLVIRSPKAIRRTIWAPGELGLARAFVVGELDVEGSALEMLAVLSRVDFGDRSPWRSLPEIMRAAARVGALGPPLSAPGIEYRPKRGRSHTLRRDASAISHHYDVSNEFYELVLGPSLTYSCARFSEPGMDLAEAQGSKHEHICRKLGLHQMPGARLLDVGCGWGSLAIHAAMNHGATVVGITISREQAAYAAARVTEAGLDGKVEIRLQDYRDLDDGPFDAVSSVGMFEHVGSERIEEYFTTLHKMLRPQGRLLNHAISSVGGSRISPRSFLYRYVFPDGELIDVGDTVLAMERAGFEVRDVESLREHYATTLRHWVSNLESHWDRAVALAGVQRARVWRLYMAASAIGFEDGGNNIHQALGVVPAADGSSGMPAVRPV